jgi:CRISPR-associated protein Cmr3
MCKWYEMNIEPRDVLFFRRAKPISGSAIGEGAQWPMPSVFHHALLSAFHAKWPETKTKHQHIRDDENKSSTFLYGDLKTVGVFPAIGNTLYFPMPADVQCKDKEGKELTILKPGMLSGESDLPAPLEMGLFKDGEATKAKPAAWISCRGLQSYLNGDVQKKAVPDLFEIESRPGIGMDLQTGTADTGKFYIAEYMRLHEGVSLKGFAAAEALEPYFADSARSEFVFGGQRGVAFLDGVRDDAKLPAFGNPTGTRIKWLTLTPSIFTGGWLPSWVDKNGEILKFEMPRGETKKTWRKRPVEERKELAVRNSMGQLVAACIPKAIPYSGWKAHATDTEGAKPTRLCVPAGAVYYFETQSEEETQRLVEFLNGKRKSDMAAEKGFGFGLCGVWKRYEGKGENQ